MKILIAEDEPVTRHLLKTSLERWQYEVSLATNGAEALDILLGRDAPKLAILDWIMPGTDGVDVCREVRKRDAGSYIYTLLLTSKAGKEDVIRGLEAGADDYLIKPFDLLELKARLRAGERIVELQEQLVAAKDAMRELAMRDPLTGLWNRRAILETLDREFNRSRRNSSSLALLMMDIDHFKQINDTRGHQAGDGVLREIAARIRSVLRTYDSVGRYGGEEFLLIVSGCDGSSAAQLAERIREQAAARPFLTASGPVTVTVSLGAVCIEEDSTAEALIRRADEALYRAKDAGRNCCAIA